MSFRTNWDPSKINRHNHGKLRSFGAAIATFVAITSPSSVSPQQNSGVIEVDLGEPYEHEASAVTFKSQVANLSRTTVRIFKSENDISAMYQGDGGETFATIYVTRVGTPDPYLWFHRVSGLVAQREGFEPMMAAGIQPEFFTAPGFDRPSGVRASYTIRNSALRSTGIALMAYGHWLVKIRVTSGALDRNDLDGLMDRFVSGFSLPSATGNEPVPYLVQSCSDKLQMASDAVQLKPTTVMATAQGVIEMSAHVVDDDERPIPSRVEFCVDQNSDARFSLYRPNGTHSGYLLSYDDTGSALIVGYGGHSFLSGLKQGEHPSFGFGLVHQMPDRSEIFAAFDKLPTPELAAKIPGNQSIIGWTDRDQNITIVTGLD